MACVRAVWVFGGAQLSKLTVPQLKSFLQQCGLAVSAKLRKPQLLELLQDHCLAAQHQQAANKDEPTAE